MIREKAFRSVCWWVGVGFILVVAVAAMAVADMSFDAYLFPLVIAVATFFTALTHAMLGLVRGVVVDTSERIEVSSGHFFALLAAILLFLCAIAVLGVFIAVPLFLFALQRTEGEKTGVALLSAAGGGLFFYLVLETALDVSLPTPLLFQSFR